ncbi:hypothetical protein Tco_0861878 [Tanacetum coccineum]
MFKTTKETKADIKETISIRIKTVEAISTKTVKTIKEPFIKPHHTTTTNQTFGYHALTSNFTNSSDDQSLTLKCVILFYFRNNNLESLKKVDLIVSLGEEYSRISFRIFRQNCKWQYLLPATILIVSPNSLRLSSPFGKWIYLLLEEADTFLALANDPTSPEVDEAYYDPEGYILLLESLLNSDPSPSLNQRNYLPEIRKELKVCKSAESTIDNPLRLNLRDLPTFISNMYFSMIITKTSLPVIIAKDLSR